MSEFAGFESVGWSPEAEHNNKRLGVAEDPVIMRSAKPLLDGRFLTDDMRSVHIRDFCRALIDEGYFSREVPADMTNTYLEMCRNRFLSEILDEE